jgi:uncharacterized protein with ATP-grasp and redox domains
MFHRPSAPLPAPMTGLDPASWAYDTITRRWPEISQRVMVENELAASIKTRIEALIADLPYALIRPLDDPGAPDLEPWYNNIQPYRGQNWLTPPWFFTEHYFYRRVIEAIGYFQPGEGHGLDPFSYQKRQGLKISRIAIGDLATGLESWTRRGGDREPLARMLYLDLWGNQADLSMWPAEGESKPDHNDLDRARAFLLADEATTVADFLLGLDLPVPRIDFWVDNAGFELVGDLALADYLLTSGIAAAVRLHVKPHPTYVSDAMVKDVRGTLDFFRAEDHTQVKALGSRLVGFLDRDRLQVRDHFFWTSPLAGWEMPLPLREELSAASLVISKGDANYRRLLGDRHWPYTTPFADILSYFPAPICALRTVKAEIACGLQPVQAETVTAQDPAWMIDGRWGVVQFTNPQNP